VAGITNPHAILGTPLYLSPEAVNTPDRVDARADVYAVGAVGYFLLTGTPVFSGATVVEICMKHAREEPEPPSRRSGKPVSAGLEAVLLRCLAKDPAGRPCDAGELLRELEVCDVAGIWTTADAAAWWAEHGRKAQEPASRATAQKETVSPATTMEYSGD
jgi:serine/threonine protein kinase